MEAGDTRSPSTFFAILALVSVGGLVLVLTPLGPSPSAIRDLVHSTGAWAPLVFAAIYLPAAFIPWGTTVMTVAAGLAFGPLRGAALTLPLATLSGLLPFAMARRLGRSWVESRVGASRARRYAELINRNAFLVFFYLRLVPGLPYEAQNYIAGVSRISTGRFLLASLLGLGPILLILTFLGDSLTDLRSPAFGLAATLFLLVILGPLAVAALLRRSGRRALLDRLAGPGPGGGHGNL